MIYESANYLKTFFFFHRNPHDSIAEAIKVKNPLYPQNSALISVLLASGFRRIPVDSATQYFLPCPVGTFSNFSSKGTDGCTSCPPGINRDLLAMFQIRFFLKSRNPIGNFKGSMYLHFSKSSISPGGFMIKRNAFLKEVSALKLFCLEEISLDPHYAPIRSLFMA